MKHIRSEKGQSLIEAALVLTVLLLLVLGVINFALIFYVHVGVVNAANVGATYAGASPARANDLTGITAMALGESGDWRCNGQPAVTSTLGSDPSGGVTVRVTVRCQVAGLVPMPLGFDEVTVSGTAVRRVAPNGP